MPVSRTVTYKPDAPPESYWTKEEKELRAKNPPPHLCHATDDFKEADKKLKAGELGPGSIYTCGECEKQRVVVHLGVKQIDDSLPLAWKNLGR